MNTDQRPVISDVTKTFTFDASHRLFGYPGNCRNMHGHTYKVDITVALRAAGEFDDYGFITDFNNFKAIKKWVDDNWDHAFIVSDRDTEMIAFLEQQNQRHYVIDYNPTAEIMATELAKIAKSMIDNERVYVAAVAIWETPTSKATVVFED